MNRPIITTLCGSTRFPDAFAFANMHLSMLGRIVIGLGMMGHADQPVGARFLTSDGDETTPEKQHLDQLHFRKIDISDGIFVVNPGGYVGSSTKREIAYAQSIGKTVEWMFAPAAPRTGSGVSVEEIARAVFIANNRVHGGTDETAAQDWIDGVYPEDRQAAFDAAHALLTLFAQAPRDGGETQGGWQPIETAPKDGTLIGVPGGCANWNEDGQYWYSAVGHSIGRPIQWNVTHWKSLDPASLPTPPSGVETIRQDNTGGGL